MNLITPKQLNDINKKITGGLVYDIDSNTIYYYANGKYNPIINQVNAIFILTNLLGNYGDFETDSNGDGIADGWSKSLSGNPTLVTSFDGSKAQKISFTNNGSSWINIERIITTDPNRILNRTFFFRSYAKTSYGGTATGNEAFPRSLYLVGRKNTNTWIQLISLLFDWNVWNCKYGTYTFTNPSITNLSIVGFYVGHPANPVDSFFEAIVDKMMLVDLTAMGDLPYPLQAFFAPSGITSWEDLATSSNITAINGFTQSGEDWLNDLLPYVNNTQQVFLALYPNLPYIQPIVIQ